LVWFSFHESVRVLSFRSLLFKIFESLKCLKVSVHVQENQIKVSFKFLSLAMLFLPLLVCSSLIFDK
jgi:hypothetical protein